MENEHLKIKELALFNACMVVQAMMEHGQLATPTVHNGGWQHNGAPRLSPQLVVEYATAFEGYLSQPYRFEVVGVDVDQI